MVEPPLFTVEDLHVDSRISGVSMTVEAGELHVVLGRAGTTAAFAAALVGSPAAKLSAGSLSFQGDDITHWPADVRAKAGVFFGFRAPLAVPGVSVFGLLGQAIGARGGPPLDVADLQRRLVRWSERLDIEPGFLDRSLNDVTDRATSARSELLQLAMLDPDIAILDRTGDVDGGNDPADLDGDELRAVVDGLRTIRAERPGLGTLAITPHPELAEHLQPDRVHVLVDGRIVASGGPDLATRFGTDGYESFP